MGFKILCLGDPHFKVNNLPVMKLYVDQIEKLVLEEKPDLTVILGDVLHNHSHLNVFPLCDAIDFIKKVSSLSKTVLLIGNHDRPSDSVYLSPIHPFYGLDSLEDFSGKKTGLIICDSVKKFSLKKGKKEFLFVGVPYVPPGRFEEALSTIGSLEGVDLIFAHQEFKGCRMGKIVSTEGDLWSLDSPSVVSGHIHSYQRIQKNLLYVGTAMQHDFGEVEEKGVFFFTYSSSQEKTSLPSTSPNHFWNHKRRPLKLPLKKTQRISFSEIAKTKPSWDGELRIIISGTPEEINTAAKMKKISEWQKKGIKVIYDDLEVTRPPSAIEVNRVDFFLTLEEEISSNQDAVHFFKRLRY